MKIIEYSVVVPVYNSEGTLEELFLQIRSVFEKSEKSFEVIFVEDCGRDKSWDVLTRLKEECPEHITAIKLNRNYGQHSATLCGMNYSRGDHIITIDDDLQTPPGEINKLIERYDQTEAELIYGTYRVKKHSAFRNMGSALVQRMLNKHSSRQFKGPSFGMLNKHGSRQFKGSSFRMLKRSLVNRLISHHQDFIYIDALTAWYTDDIEMVEVEHQERKNLKSGYSSAKLTALSIKIFIYYTIFPLKIMIYGGMFASIISFFVGIYYLLRKLFFHVPVGYTSIIVTVLFSTSILLLSLGIIGDYLRKIYIEQKKIPPYLIKKILK